MPAAASVRKLPKNNLRPFSMCIILLNRFILPNRQAPVKSRLHFFRNKFKRHMEQPTDRAVEVMLF